MDAAIRELIEKLRHANGPEAGLDREIARLMPGAVSGGLPFTSSFDAAKQLIPSGVDIWELSAAGGVTMMQMQVLAAGGGYVVSGTSRAESGREAIATVICCLEAELASRPALPAGSKASAAAAHH